MFEKNVKIVLHECKKTLKGKDNSPEENVI